MSAIDELKSALEGMSAVVTAPRHAEPGAIIRVRATFGWFREADEAQEVVYKLGWTFVEQPDVRVVDLPDGRGVQVRFVLVVPPDDSQPCEFSEGAP